MALQLNLLHEQFAQQRQRQRDPLKLGVLFLCGLGVLMVFFYVLKGYQTLGLKSRLATVEHDWKKVEPEVTAAQKRSAELTATINTTKVLDTVIESRFYWAPFLQTVSRSVAPNAQITNLQGSIAEDGKAVSLTIEGNAAGQEPRSAAEELRQLLSEQLQQSYTEVKVEFKALEDLDNSVTVPEGSMALAHFVLGVSLNPLAPEFAKAGVAPAPRASQK